MRRYTITFSSITILVIFTFWFSDVKTNIIQPPSARTGAPGEVTCGESACHNNTPNSGVGAVNIAFSDPDALYLPGNTYNVTVTVSEAVQVKFGFEITSLDASNTQAGTFAEITGGSDISFPISTNGRLYASHHNASATNTWTFNWTAPITDVGPITFYAAGNAANGNNASTGDHIYTTTFQVMPDSNIGIDDLAFGTTPFVVQNPVSTQLNVQYETISMNHSRINLYNLNGQLVKTLFNGNEAKGLHTHAFILEGIESGLYLIQFNSGKTIHSQKIIVE